MKVYEAIASELARRAISPLFGLIGDANLYMVDHFIRELGGRYVAAAHEASAVFMAMGYARVTNQVGVATVTHGPGLTNTLTALVFGVKARVPLVLLAGDTAVGALSHPQKIDQREFIRATGAEFVQLRSPATVADDIALAFRLARLKQIPAVLNIPIEFQWEECVLNPVREDVQLAPLMTPSGTEFDNAIGIIAAARAPIVLAGRGAVRPQHRDALVTFAERIGAPLATTLQARNLFDGDSYNLGIFGTLSEEPAIEAIAKCDCVIAFGASLNRFTTDDNGLLKGKRLIHVDPEPAAIGRHARPDAALVGDPALMANLFVEWLDAAEISASGFRTPQLAEKIAGWQPAPVCSKSVPAGTVDIRQALLALDHALPADRIVATDGGRFLGEAWKRIGVKDPHDFVSPVGFAAIGSGMPLAIGAAFADEQRTTVLITGDGGFMLGGINEICTAVHNKLNLIIIICNDDCYGAEHVQFRDRGLDPSLSMLHWPDFAPIAEAMGGAGVTIRGAPDISVAIELIERASGVIVIDVKLDPNYIPDL